MSGDGVVRGLFGSVLDEARRTGMTPEPMPWPRWKAARFLWNVLTVRERKGWARINLERELRKFQPPR